jgi:hypothetical protein
MIDRERRELKITQHVVEQRTEVPSGEAQTRDFSCCITQVCRNTGLWLLTIDSRNCFLPAFIDLLSIDYQDYSGRMSTYKGLFKRSCLFVLILATLVTSYTDYSQYVNPLIGSEGPIPGLTFGGG